MSAGLPAMAGIAVAAVSELGQRRRNEDRVGSGGDAALRHAILADGAGGHHGGAEAAYRTVVSLDAFLLAAAARYGAAALTEGVLAAHADVRAAQSQLQGMEDMRTTVVVLWIDMQAGVALWSHVGDSRLYRARHGELSMLTIDDSVVQRMFDAGLLTAEQARDHPQKNQLIAALGIDDEIDPHTLAEPERLEAGDAFLLCSDGWWSALDEDRILAALLAAETPEAWLRLMQQDIEAQAVPRQDNFSAVAVWVAEAVHVAPLEPQNTEAAPADG